MTVDDLTSIGHELRSARTNLVDVIATARAAAIEAAAVGVTEVMIAQSLGVGRNTVREWLGKPRHR